MNVINANKHISFLSFLILFTKIKPKKNKLKILYFPMVKFVCLLINLMLLTH